MTNIAKRAPKTTVKKELNTNTTAWGTFEDGNLTSVHMTRTEARQSGLGTPKKVTVQISQ